VFEGKNKLRY